MNYSQNPNRKQTTKRRSKKKRRKNRAGVVILRILVVLVIIGVFAVVGGFLGAYIGIIESAPTINTADVVPESYTSILYDSAGNELDRLHGNENREYVKLSEIPKNLQNAVVAIEDERFFDHNGVDFRGMLRALVVNIKTMSFSQGASTITQQLIKNEVLTQDKLLKRKLQEQYLAVQLEKDLAKSLGSKQKAKEYILELYLNTIGLNHGLNGVQSASLFYFGKDVSELTLAECASIAGITKNPTAYSPISYPDNNRERQLTVLRKMLDLGYITQEEYEAAKAEDIYSKLVGATTSDDGNALHSYFVDQVIVDVANALMEEKGMNRTQAYNLIYSGGLSIHTTMDQTIQNVLDASYAKPELFPPIGRDELMATYTISIMDLATEEQSHYTRTSEVQNQAEAEAFAETVKAELLNDSNKLVLDHLSVGYSLQSAMVIMDQHTGYVKALIGGRGDKPGDQVFNRATQAMRQPGSCYKVLAAYAPALDLGLVNPGTIIVDEPFTVAGWTPRNWYRTGYRGACTVREGIRDSLNILAAKTITMVTPDKAFEYLLNFGFTTLVESREVNGQVYSDKNYAASLGGLTDGVTVLELTAAYAAIANGGVYLKPTTFTEVYDHDGNLLLTYDSNEHRVIKESVAFLLTDMMEDVVTGGGTGGLARFKTNKMPIAGKTGTTTNDVDLTFAGYTPYYTAGIWLGYDQPKSMTYDKSYHLLLWSDVMDQLHNNLAYKEFEMPANVGRGTICGVTNSQANPGVCELDYYAGNAARSDYYALDTGSISSSTCSVHQLYTIDNTTGYLAGDNCPMEYHETISLPIDSNGEIMDKPDPVPEDKLDIKLETCPETHADYKSPDAGVIGGDSLPLPPGGDGTHIPGENTGLPDTTEPTPNPSNPTTPNEPTAPEPPDEEPLDPNDIPIGADDGTALPIQ